jgi:uncharacterized membrane protein
VTRLGLWWERAFWVVPLLGVLLAMWLSELTSELDEAVFADPSAELISESAATTMLAAVGGAMVTFTGFVFSLVLLLLQFGSSQYSPRTVAFFLRARSTQVILAIFLATSLFCFLTLLGVGSGGRADFSPSASVVVAALLLITSLVAFIVLMHLVSKRIRIDAVVTSLGAQTRASLARAERRLARYDRADAPAPEATTEEGAPASPETGLRPVRYLGRGGQVVAVDWRRLRRVARRRGIALDVAVRVGDGLSPGRRLAVASGEGRDDRAVSRCFVVYGERSLRLDPTYGLRILVDIALKGLSPAVDDPTTATRALDEIDGVLRAAARLPLRTLTLAVQPRVTVPTPTWPDVVDLAVREIRLAGLNQPQITRRLSALLTDLAADLPPDRAECVREHLAALREQVPSVVTASEVGFALATDRQGIGGTR